LVTESLCIVGGCGHVGLPLGIAFARAGCQVTLLDRDAHRITEVNSGRMPFRERGADEALVEVVRAGRLSAVSDATAVASATAVIITIGTPLDEYMNPHVLSFERFMGGVLDRMSAGQLLVLRSTVYPGVTDRLLRRVLERGLDLDVVNCPERIAQGYAMEELATLPQLVGAVTERARRRAADLFSALGAKPLFLGPTEVELAKLFANAYRYINFAISNQFYMTAQRFGVDFHRVHEAVVNDYPRLAGMAGAGFAGGPCLLKDTMQLAAFRHNEFPLGHAAMLVNEELPIFVVDRADREHQLADKTTAILGMAFKGNNDDHRDSLAFKLRKILTLRSRRVLCTDPCIEGRDFVSLEAALEGADVVFVGCMHREYAELHTSKPVIDVFNFVRVSEL
jgi:UDP-N-acetyl-D-mannosaminuronic acid dehydrogenase